MVSKKRFLGYVVSFHKGILVENYTNNSHFKTDPSTLSADYYTVKICFQSKLCKIHRFVKSDMPTSVQHIFQAHLFWYFEKRYENSLLRSNTLQTTK